MDVRGTVAIAALAFALVSAGAHAQSPAAPMRPAGSKPIPGHFIVVLKSGKGPAAADRVERRARARGGRVQRQYRSALNAFSAELSDDALAEVRADPDVAFVEPDVIVSSKATQSGATWGLDRIDQRSCRSTGRTTTARRARA